MSTGRVGHNLLTVLSAAKQLDDTETAATWMLVRVAQQGDDLRSAQVLSQLEMLMLIISA